MLQGSAPAAPSPSGAPPGPQNGDSARTGSPPPLPLLGGSAVQPPTPGSGVPSQPHRDAVALPPADAVSSVLPGMPQRSRAIPRELQQREASRYRLALKRMAGDLLSLRRHVTSLEVENGHLRHRLAGHEEPGGALLADLDVDVMTREEVLDRLGAWSGRAEKGTPLCGGPRCPLVVSRKLRMWPGALAATLKGELVAGTMEMRRLKDRVQQLQNELIRVPAPTGMGMGWGRWSPPPPAWRGGPRGFFPLFSPQKNDREKELVLLQRAHRQQQAALRRCQEQAARAKGLEETVIKVMERVLQDRLSMSSEKPAGDLHALLLAENRRLREELARPPRPPSPPMAPRASHGTRDIFGGTEKLSLLARLEEAQARGRVMERQLEEAARRWGREKQELGTRLLEQEHGFGGSAPRSPHIPTSKQPPGSTFPPRRPRTLDPLP
ncbi:coiled-coil domain-containing protein 33 isoform X2 [Anas acuta]|uniref:coiled-coil domain-containing protein 33 isoform X2 n=1 Tax=Anas acuta TaxID=28680 RepID=UPI0035C8D7E7